MLSSSYFSVALLSIFLLAATPGGKRTILTSGEKVHVIHYQLGQSTVLYFGMKPDTVICGNKNYFNIEKIKEGLTIQPLSNFSTNLTVLTQGKRFLFYLTPANGGQVDSFVDVRWVSDADTREVATASSKTKLLVRDFNQKLRLGHLELRFKREVRIDTAKRSILEFEVTNTGGLLLKPSEIEILAVKGVRPLEHQAFVFEKDELKSGEMTTGRLILTGADFKGATIVANYLGKSGKIQLQRAFH